MYYLNYSGEVCSPALQYEICQLNYNYVSLKISTEIIFFFFLLTCKEESVCVFTDSQLQCSEWQNEKLIFFKYITEQLTASQ